MMIGIPEPCPQRCMMGQNARQRGKCFRTIFNGLAETVCCYEVGCRAGAQERTELPDHFMATDEGKMDVGHGVVYDSD